MRSTVTTKKERENTRTEESLKRELARLCKEHTALFKQVVQDTTSWQRMETIERKTINVRSQLTEHFPGWTGRVPQFGLVAEEVEKVNPDLVARNADAKINTVRYQAVKWQRRLEANITQLQSAVAKQEVSIAHQQTGMEVFAATLKVHTSQIQKVSDLLQLRASDPLELMVKDPLELSNAAPQLVGQSRTDSCFAPTTTEGTNISPQRLRDPAG